LDSFAALNIMGHLSSLAKMGKTIVASIHQPRTAIFDKFDKVSLLSEGKQMFFGAPADAVRWFGQIGYPFLAQPGEGLSDWLLDLISIGFHKPGKAGRSACSFSHRKTVHAYGQVDTLFRFYLHSCISDVMTSCLLPLLATQHSDASRGY
jgi:ABC-type multidrug transport system ATPase subunit